jgi:uncharacterized protein YjbI with pentapeptide repeats
MGYKLTKKAGFVLAVAGAAIVGGAATALVQAAIPSTGDGQIHACYRNSATSSSPKGALRVIDSQATPAQTCTAQETALNFNQSGSGGLKKDLSNNGYMINNNFAFLDLNTINFSGSDVGGSNFRGADMRGATLTNAKFTTTNLTDADMSGQSLSGVNFTGATFTGTNITGVTWTNVTCPDGTNSGSNGNTCVGHL